jgi:hypothetical protein
MTHSVRLVHYRLVIRSCVTVHSPLLARSEMLIRFTLSDPFVDADSPHYTGSAHISGSFMCRATVAPYDSFLTAGFVLPFDSFR